MNRRLFLGSLPALSTLAAFGALPRHSLERSKCSSKWDEWTIPQFQDALARGKITAASLVKHYRRRIEKLDWAGPALRSVLELNPDALAIARELDEERRAGRTRGPLHGIPILLKDNIATGDRMMTTAGSLALVGARPSRDAFLVEQLRKSGAVILGKTNLSEWANFRSHRSTSGWSGRGGLTRNPYALDRNTSGSSSGSGAAVAANFCAAAIGTETDGSIVSPATYCGIVGLKPTVGLISRSGIIPISATQDTAGPMTRTVTDAAILLSALAGVDPGDEPTRHSEGRIPSDYASFLQKDGLKGARIGVARQLFHIRSDRVKPLLEKSLGVLKACGAELIDPVKMPSFGHAGDAEYQVMLYEFKDGLNRYLAGLGPESPIKSLADLIAYNEAHADSELPYFGQEVLIEAEKKGPLTDKAYLEAREDCRVFARDEGIDPVLAEHRLDALVAPSGGPAHRTDLIYGDRDTGGSSTYAAVAGYPSITVPAGYLQGLPFGLSFFGGAWSEPTLLKLAYAFEQATLVRRSPEFPPSVGEV